MLFYRHYTLAAPETPWPKWPRSVHVCWRHMHCVMCVTPCARARALLHYTRYALCAADFHRNKESTMNHANSTMYWNLACSNEATNYSYRESILVRSNGGYDLHPQEHPIFGKVLPLDYFQSFEYRILAHLGIDHGFLGNTFSSIFSSTD